MFFAFFAFPQLTQKILPYILVAQIPSFYPVFQIMFFFCGKCGTLLCRLLPTVAESAHRTSRNFHSKTVHHKTGEHHQEQSKQLLSKYARSAITRTSTQRQWAGRSPTPDSKSMLGGSSIALLPLYTHFC